jgi:SAM-dependent methyltransferase
MSQSDQKRWDKKWADISASPFDPHPLLLAHPQLLSGGRALDLACGRGQNTLWLARQGYQAIGVDISSVALKSAASEARILELTETVLFVQADLDYWGSSTDAFDLICVFRFLNRNLFPSIWSSLKAGGCLFYSTRHIGLIKQHPEATRDYLLESDELLTVFGHWHIIHYREGTENAELVARKPAH